MDASTPRTNAGTPELGVTRPLDSGPLPGSGPRGAERGGPEPALGRRIAFIVAALVLSSIAGVTIVQLHVLVAVGLVAAAISTLLILLRPFWGLLLYTCLFVLRPAELYPALGALHLERVVGFLALAAMFLDQYRRERRIFIDASRQTMLLMLFMGAVLLSVPFSYWRGGAMEGFLEVVRIVILYLLVVHLTDTRGRLRAFVVLFCLLTLYTAGTAYYGYVTGSTTLFVQGIERAVGETSSAANPNELGTTLAAGIPLFLLFALRRSPFWLRLSLVLGGLLLLATMAVTGSRASLLGFLGGLVWLWWKSRHRILLGIAGLIFIAAGYAVLPDQYKQRYGTITNQELDGSSQARVQTWMTGLRMVMDRPFFGVGIRCFGTAHAMNYSPGASRNWLEAHSLYVQVPAELGLVGAAVFFTFVFEFLRLNRRTARRLREAGERWRFERALLDALFAGFVVLLISGFFGHSLLRRTWYLYAGLGLVVQRLLAAPGEPGPRAEPRAVSPARGGPADA